MSTPKFTAPETPVTREEVYYDAILRGLNGDSPAPVIPTPVWRMEEYLAAIAEAASSGGGSSLPAVTSADNGKVLGVVDGEWAASEKGKRFIVTLTPTSPDYSGTMDKTVAEINAAYEAGQEIWFKVGTEAQGYAYIPANQISLGNMTYPSFEATLLNPGVGLMYAYTGFTDDGTTQTYETTIYSLTPAS